MLTILKFSIALSSLAFPVRGFLPKILENAGLLFSKGIVTNKNVFRIKKSDFHATVLRPTNNIKTDVNIKNMKLGILLLNLGGPETMQVYKYPQNKLQFCN
jgi:hypothetical protein